MTEETTSSAPSPSPTPVSFEAGTIVEGTVSGVTSFGAFVRIAPRVEGLVHISEIAHEYVANVENYVQLNQTVKVKILGLNKKGKYDLSIKQANPQVRDTSPTPHHGGGAGRSYGGGSSGTASTDDRPTPPMANKMIGRYRKVDKEQLNPFEEKMMDFLKKSEEKLIDFKRNLQTKQGVKKRKKK